MGNAIWRSVKSLTRLVSAGVERYLRASRPAKLGMAVLLVISILFILNREPNQSFHTLPDAACEPWEPDPQLEENARPFPERCSSIEKTGDAQLAYVEFDDQGDYFDQRQSFAAMHLIRNALSETASPVELFVFIHGWQHNASPQDEHVKQFRKFLSARNSNCKSGCIKKKVIGIYVGWPGKTLNFPLNGLTFWSRKAAAHRVASGSIQEFFATLQQVKMDNESSKYQVNLKTYVIGHSFGGLIAFQANSQSLAIRYGSAVLNSRGMPQARSVGDLLILINPAIEALRFTSLHSLWSEYPNDPFYSPVMVVVGSRSDYATKILFPLGVTVGTLATNQIRDGQWSETLTTIGNAKGYFTHNTYVDADGGIVVCERPHALSQRKAPFWFISANPNLIDGHGDLNSQKLQQMFSTIKMRVDEKTLGGLPSCKGTEPDR